MANVVVITGGGSGMGLEAAKYMPKEKIIILSGRTVSKLENAVNTLKDLGFTYTDPQGAYYVMVNVGEFSKGDDVAFCEWMARNVGVAAVPACTFFKEDVHDWVRFHFAKRDETLYEALNRLEGLRSKL